MINKNLKKNIYKLMPLKWAINHNYRGILHKNMNWKEPKDINEKINWLKINGDTSQWSSLADKYSVREYVKKKGLSHILVPLCGVYSHAEDVNFTELPNSFVLKTNHGSGDCVVVKDKSLVCESKIKEDLSIALKERYGLFQGEPHYLRIKPVIIAEALLDNDELGFTTSLIDYKIWCFNGEPYSIWACYSRTKKHTYVNTYDLEWECHPETSIYNDHYRDGGGIIPKPKTLNEMLEVASILSKGFPQVRVDLYNCKGKIYFGEMTFTGNGGYMDFYTTEYLRELGDQIELLR